MKKVIIIGVLKGGTTIAGYPATHMGNFIEHAERIGLVGNINSLTGTVNSLTGTVNNLTGTLNSLTGTIGNLALLTTNNKENLVQAINETKQYANDGKTRIGNVVGIPTNETFAQMEGHIQWRKDRLATNLTNKGIPSVGTELLVNLIDKVAQIQVGRRWSSGYILWEISSTSGNLQTLTINNLPFTPSIVIVQNHLGFAYRTYYYDYDYNEWIPNPYLYTVNTDYLHLSWNGIPLNGRVGGGSPPVSMTETHQLSVISNGFTFVYNVFKLASNERIEGNNNNCSVTWIAIE